MAGLSPTGFVAKTTREILDSIRASVQSDTGGTANLSSLTSMGNILASLSNELGIAWEALGDVYALLDPDRAEGVGLDGVIKLTGTLRKGATRTLVEGVAVNVDVGTYPAGSLIAHIAGDASKRFVNLTEVVRVGSTGNESVDFEAEDAGATVVNLGQLNEIASAFPGWNSVSNPVAGITGTETEEDPAARQRQRDELAAVGSTTVDAIRADLLALEGVTSATVIENDTDQVVDGIPPNRVESIIEATATDAELAAQIFASKAGGIRAHGAITAVVQDSQGNDHVVSFTRPAPVEIHIAITVRVLDGYGGDAALEAAIAAAAAASPSHAVGFDVVWSFIGKLAHDADPNVFGVDSVFLGTAPSPTLQQNVPITIRQRAAFDVARISVSSNTVSP